MHNSLALYLSSLMVSVVKNTCPPVGMPFTFVSTLECSFSVAYQQASPSYGIYNCYCLCFCFCLLLCQFVVDGGNCIFASWVFTTGELIKHHNTTTPPPNQTPATLGCLAKWRDQRRLVVSAVRRAQEVICCLARHSVDWQRTRRKVRKIRSARVNFFFSV